MLTNGWKGELNVTRDPVYIWELLEREEENYNLEHVMEIFTI